ncbi:uncharacterized protein LOC118366081 isoform X3 [Oncorhynchus keta]|uniref:uncharacterized protein LOC118366081 isoform X3 n=1 Tax=Oncorhynchus keta TaxID=8018 RepID=UPI00227B95BD|nr:uncharacterized protein LOC118366081 isoform X3 [Oncorhynchus keta]
MTCNLVSFLSVFSVVVKSQLKPQVSMVLTFKQVYSGDTIILSCDNSTGKVKWFFNKVEDQNQANKTWSIRAVSAKNSGSYQCENNGQKSDNFNITVLEYLPPATLLIKSGEPVINIYGSVVLELLVEEDENLKGWCCWVYKAGGVHRITLRKSLTTENHKVLTFQPSKLNDPVAIYWCSDETNLRSTPLTIKTSGRVVRMMILPGPALLGEKLSLRCVVSGTDRISHTIFYKDKQTIKDGSSSSYVINNVTESDQGIYSCQATFTRRDKGMPSTFNSTQQELIVSAPPMKAVVSESAGLSCSCSSCPNGAFYHWYYKQHNPQWLPKGISQSYTGFMPAGSYACRAVWKNGRSALSDIHHYDVDAQETHVLLITIGLIVLGVMLVIGAIVMYRKRRTREEAIYQDMPLMTVKSQDGGDGGYEELHKKHGTKREGEYDTLNTTPAQAAGGEKTEGAYEALKKAEGKEEEYHTLEEGAAKGGDGGYEALKKSKDEGTGDLYHTLGEKGAKGGDGGYEALKKSQDEGTGDLYHTLGEKGANGGDGGYEALKKSQDGGTEDLSHALGAEGGKE